MNGLGEHKETIEDMEDDKERLEQIRTLVLQSTYLITFEQFPETNVEIIHTETPKKEESLKDIRERGHLLLMN